MIKNSKFKSFPKILIIFFLATFIVQLSCLIFLFTLPRASQASGASGSWGDEAKINFTPQVQIGDYKFDNSDKTTGNIAHLIQAIYNYGIGIIGILAAVVLMIGGVLWIVAGGNTTQIGEAKAWIGAALTGLVLALTSYLILSTVNPALVNLQSTKILGIANMNGCCTTTETNGVVSYQDNVYVNDCAGSNKKYQEGLCPKPISTCSYKGEKTGCGYLAKTSGFLGSDTCEKMGQLTSDMGCCDGKTKPGYCDPNINNCYCCCPKIEADKVVTGSCTYTEAKGTIGDCPMCVDNLTSKQCIEDHDGAFSEGKKCDEIAQDLTTGSCKFSGKCATISKKSCCDNNGDWDAKGTCPSSEKTGSCTTKIGICTDNSKKTECEAVSGNKFVENGTCPETQCCLFNQVNSDGATYFSGCEFGVGLTSKNCSDAHASPLEYHGGNLKCERHNYDNGYSCVTK